MTFIITLIALIMERFFHWHHLRHWRWFIDYERQLAGKTQRLPAYLRLGLSVLPPLIIVGLIALFCKGRLYGILEFIFSVFVLLYCLGPQNLWVDVYRCLQVLVQEGEMQAAEEVNTTFGTKVSSTPHSLHEDFIGAIFIAAHQRIFSVMFWFVVAGPVGAVFYRLIELFSMRPEMGLLLQSQWIKAIMDWLPIRILAFLFALGGHFTRVFAIWHKKMFLGLKDNGPLLVQCGIAALDGPLLEGEEEGGQEKNALALLDRVFIIALVILATLVLIF